MTGSRGRNKQRRGIKTGAGEREGQVHGRGQCGRDHGEGWTREGAGAWEGTLELEGPSRKEPGRGELDRSL